VTYDGNGQTGGAVPSDPKEYYEGDTVGILGNTKDLVKEGYHFKGWLSDEDTPILYGAADLMTMPAKDITLTAQWEADPVIPTYGVTYDANGATAGSVPTDTKEYEEGDRATVSGNSGNLVKEGFHFVGWLSDEDAQVLYQADELLTMPGRDITLTAQWEADSPTENPSEPPTEVTPPKEDEKPTPESEPETGNSPTPLPIPTPTSSSKVESSKTLNNKVPEKAKLPDTGEQVRNWLLVIGGILVLAALVLAIWRLRIRKQTDED
jgi:uncharacterized repeat protein (TIGR02543 family)/LPXTG-motif cell wall-anchored protein